MKMRSISENKFTDLADKLNKEVEKFGESDLRGLVKDPRQTVDLIKRGALSKTFVLANQHWIEQFLGQWHLLDEDTLQRTFELAYKDVIDKYQSMQDKTKTEDAFRSDLVMMEGVGSFLGKLAKWTMLIIKLMAMAAVSSSGGGGYGGRGGRRGSPDDFRVLNPFAAYNLTKRLYDTSVHVSRTRTRTP